MNYPVIVTDISGLVNKLDHRFNQLEQNFNNLEQRFSKIEECLDRLETNQADIKAEIKALDNKLKESKKQHLTVVANETLQPSKKFGKLQNWRKITFVIITAMVGLFVGKATIF